MFNPTRPKAIQNVLHKLPYRGMPALKELFWSELSYESINSTLSRRSWTNTDTDKLLEDPTILAAGGIDNEFKIIYSRLQSDRVKREDERHVATQLLKEHPYSLFVFSNAEQSNWDFVNVRDTSRSESRRLFRRIAVGPDEHLRTASEQLAIIDLGRFPKTLFGPSHLEIQKLHDEAFDVEPVTREFFRQYADVFHRVEKLLRGFADDERKRLFTQRLFNRLMFIAFVQKKKWLRLHSSSGADYLGALWADYKRACSDDCLFYRDRLEVLFFSGLNNSQERDILHINGGGMLRKLIGDVPFLNGGLFEKDKDEYDPTIFAPDECIEAILTELFSRYNFTVSESTPLDVEVAVDPEMLGKVFEELVTGRHESGSYYTPKPIVSFMGREALKSYLKAKRPGESLSAIDDFVNHHNPQGLRDPEGVLEALRNVKICDPACGSGAYLLGMLHELLDLRACLFNTRNLDQTSTYHRKLEIIQNNLYGVDIDKFAINIARLRLWLSLAVDYDGDNPPPLPNLRFKIEKGDSLLAPSPTGYSQQAFRDDLIARFREAKRQYMTAHGGEKENLEQEVQELKQDIAFWTHGGESVEGFDWAVEFAEVFAEGGFDIIVANPPYVRQELIKELKPTLCKVFPDVYTGTADLYVYFYARAVQLLRPSGTLAFISSNKWFRANYGANLRKHIAETCHVLSITDFGDLPVFTSAAAYPMIFLAQKGVALNKSTAYTSVESLEPPYPDVRSIIEERGQALPESAISGSTWSLGSTEASTRSTAMRTSGIPLGECLNSRIYRGVLTGLNEAFVIDDAKRLELMRLDPNSTELIKPLLTGRDIKKWSAKFQGRWLILTRIGTDIRRYSAVLEHLSTWRVQLEKRSDKGNYWWELRSCNYYDAFDCAKILFPDIAPEPRFAFDTTGAYLGNTGYIIPTDDLYLLGVLNSESASGFYSEISSQVRGGYLRFFRQFVEQIPIPSAPNSDRVAITDLVQKCLDAKGTHCEQWEQEINERVARLYGL